jgi:mannose-6-phosphate isomerase
MSLRICRAAAIAVEMGALEPEMVNNTSGRALSRHWLERAALPFWSGAGADQLDGGYHDSVDLHGRPIPGNKRARVQFRQIYCFAKAGQMGYVGPWREPMQHGLAYVFDRLLKPNGLSFNVLTGSGKPVNDQADLYDQAFLLLGLAEAYKVSGDNAAWAAAHRAAETLMSSMRHPEKGFWDSSAQRQVLRSNPHMHLLEAAIAWMHAEPRGVWREIGEICVELCMDRFMDTRTGGLIERFDANWRPLLEQGQGSVEPGHMFEWAWLLLAWERIARQPTYAHALRLYDVAVRFGICPVRDVVINALDLDLNPQDQVARLWPQTERLKASLAFAALPGPENLVYRDHAQRADKVIGSYFVGMPPGLWRDKLKPDGSFQIEPVPASSLYHLVCAAYEQLGATI